MSNTKVVRLNTGEEVIANIEESSHGNILLSKPLLLIPMQEGRLTFATWLPYNEDDFVVVSESAIVFMINPVNEMLSQYQNATGQIITPDKKIIM
jgi:hypothetical protein